MQLVDAANFQAHFYITYMKAAHTLWDGYPLPKRTVNICDRTVQSDPKTTFARCTRTQKPL